MIHSCSVSSDRSERIWRCANCGLRHSNGVVSQTKTILGSTAQLLGQALSLLLFQHEYSANFLFALWKRVRKYRACCTGITQNVDDLLQSHTARTMLANSEFLVMLNQAATDRTELARLLNISDNQLSYITNVDSGRGLIKCGSAIVPFMDNFPKNRLYKLMTTKPSDTDGTIGMGRAA